MQVQIIRRAPCLEDDPPVIIVVGLIHFVSQASRLAARWLYQGLQHRSEVRAFSGDRGKHRYVAQAIARYFFSHNAVPTFVNHC